MKIDSTLVLAGVLALSLGFCHSAEAQQEFRRGDVDHDGTAGTMSDFSLLLSAVAFGSPAPLIFPCADALDADDNGQVDFSDSIYLLGMATGEQPPLAPGPAACGLDPTADALDCSAYDCTVVTQADAPDATLSLSEASGSIGEEVAIEVSLEVSSGIPLYGMALSVTHDPSVALLVSIDVQPTAEGEPADFSSVSTNPGEWTAQAYSRFLGLWSLAPVPVIATYRLIGPGETALTIVDSPVRTEVSRHAAAGGRPNLSDGMLRVVELQRGDANGDTVVNIGDTIFLLDALFSGGAGWNCADAADANDDGRIDLADPIRILAFLFSGGLPPEAPGPFVCGSDLTLDGLFCDEPTCP